MSNLIKFVQSEFYVSFAVLDCAGDRVYLNKVVGFIGHPYFRPQRITVFVGV